MYHRRKGLVVLGISAVLALLGGLLGSSISASASPRVDQIPRSQAQGVPKARVAGASTLRREVFGFALASSLADPSVGYSTWNLDLLSTVAFFGLHVQADGTFAGDSYKTVWDSAQLRGLVGAAHAHGTRVVLTIVLQDFGPGTPNMCAGLNHTSTTIANTVAQVKAKGLDGVNVDYESLNGSCGTGDPSWARHALTGFVSALRSALPGGSYLSVDTYSSSATDPLGFFDVTGLASSADSLFVMAYDLEYSNYNHPPLSCPNFCLGPTEPLGGYYYNDASTVSQYTAAVPASKVILGVPYYGRKACVASASPNQAAIGGVIADSYLDASTEVTDPHVQAGSYASHRDANDRAGQERWDTWFNTSLGCTRELYWDDATSLGLKYDLANRTGLRGVGIWNLNYGGGAPELWSALATHFALVPGQPGNVSACAGNASATVSWTPAPTQGGPITSYAVTANPGGATATVAGTATIAIVSGLTPGTSYTFSVQAVNSGGPGVAATTGAVTASGPLLWTNYLNWYDNATPGMLGDNIHIANPFSSPSSGCVIVSGKAVAAWSVNAGQETVVTLPRGTLGGPVLVTINSGPWVLVSQRVEFYQSFNELLARAAGEAATTSYFSWFDNASPGMVNANIHLQNPGGSSANVTVSLPGTTSQTATLAPGAETFVTFPAGTIGGPVKVSSSQPVLASQRVQYYQSFNEVWASSTSEAATTSYFNWFDKASPGMVNDNIHVVNPGSASANVTVSMPGAPLQTATVAPGAAGWFTFPAGKMGGPVKVSSTQPVLASQRVQYYQSFSESLALYAPSAAGLRYFNWYDRSSPGMVGDNIHISNPGATAAIVTVNLPGLNPTSVNVAPGAEAYVTFPSGSIGGPVKITSTQPVYVTQRVQYYRSFDEVPAG